MKKITLAISIFMMLFLLMSCTSKSDLGIKPEIYKTTKSVTHTLTEYQQTFFDTHIIFEFVHTDYGFIVEYTHANNYLDRQISLITSDETL